MEKQDWIQYPTGLFVPVSTKRETFTMPGAVGGANWGSTAAIPEKGIVFVRSIDYPSVYGRAIKKSPPTKEEEEASKKYASGQTIYMSTCMACHGADRRGGVGPELRTLKDKFDIKEFHQVVNNGKGEMPAYPSLKEKDVKNLYNYINHSYRWWRDRFGGPTGPFKITGPVVDSGGAPGGLAQRTVIGPAGSFGRPG